MDIHDRSRIDEETGCWVVDASRYKGTSVLWMADYRCTMSLTMALAILMTGEKPPKGKMYVATCGNTACGNPKHRTLGDRSLLMRVMRPTLDPLHRARIARAHQKRVTVPLTPEVLAGVASSGMTQQQAAKELGIHPSTLGKALTGGSWRPVAATASVFALGGGS